MNYVEMDQLIVEQRGMAITDILRNMVKHIFVI